MPIFRIISTFRIQASTALLSAIFCFSLVGDIHAADATAVPPIKDLLVGADVAAGEKTSRACAACHSFQKGAPNKIGPNLWGIVDRPTASAAGFNYSDAMKSKQSQKWTNEELNKYLVNPRSYAPGTKMVFAGVKNDKDRANLIAWLNTLK